MYTLLVILIVVAAILMIGVVLIQESKGGGLSSNFSAQNNVLGVRKTTDVVEKTTWGLAAAMVIISVVCAYVAPRTVNQSVLDSKNTPAQQTNANNKQGFNADANPTSSSQASAENAGN